MERPNWLLDIDSTSYHEATKRGEFTTSHRLNLFRKCPLAYKQTIDGIMKEGDTAVFQFGRATHTLILEGREKYDAEYLTSDGPVNPKTDKPYGKATKAYQDWAAEQTKPVISMEDFALMVKMREAVHAHPVAADLLASGIAEGTVRTLWDGEPVQARLDWFDPESGVVADLKTCADLDKFKYDIRDFGYVTQMAFYARCLELVGYDGDMTAYLIAVEKKEPYRVGVYEICALTLEDGNEARESKNGVGNSLMIAELKKCRETNVWPTRYEKKIIV